MLGPPEIYQEDRLLRISRRSTRNLLFYLACRKGMQTRDELAFLFWGDLPDEAARKRLRETISRLRSSLANPDWILTGPDLVGLDFESIYVDLHEFNDIVNPILPVANRIPKDQPLPQPVYLKITNALSLWRSPRWMAGTSMTGSIELDDWMTNQSYQLEQIYLNLLERVSFHALVSTNLEESLYYSRQGLAIENTREGFHYITLRALLSMGRSSQAREHYQQYLHVLDDKELVTDPNLMEIVQQVKGKVTTSPARAVQPRWNLHVTLKVPFVGRQAVLDQLWQRFYKGGGALISGEIGQGKTRLLEQFSSQAAPSARLLTVTCRSTEIHLELQPIIELMRAHFEESDWLAVPAPWASQLMGIFPELVAFRPELRQFYGNTHAEPGPQTNHAVLFEAIRQALWAISQRAKLLICIDDIHWADDATFGLLTYLLERPPFSERSSILMSARFIESKPPMDLLKEYLRKSQHTTTLDLTGLTLEETGSLVRNLLSRTPTEALVGQIHKDSGGNPLYVLETVRTILEQGIDPASEQIASIPVPEKIIKLIQQRLDSLSQPERVILEIAAIYGTEFDPAVIQDASEITLDQFAQYLDQLTARSLIEPLDNTVGELGYRFVHGKFREVVLAEIPDLRQRWVHRKIAEALSRDPVLPYNHPGIMADHYEKSNDAPNAFQFWVLAAQQARRSNLVTIALEYLARAERQLRIASNLTTHQIYDFYVEWAKIAYETEQLALVQQISKTLLDVGYERRSDLLIGAAHETLSDAYMLEKNFDAALASNLQAEKYIPRTGYGLAMIQMYTRRGLYLFLLNRFPEADIALNSALEQPVDEKDPRYLQSIANTYKQLAMLSMITGWPSKSLSYAMNAQKYYQMIRDPYGQVSAYSGIAQAQLYLGNYQIARQNCEAGIELGEIIRAWRLLGFIYSHAANIDLETGNLDSALVNARQMIQLGVEQNHSEMIAIGNSIIGDIFAWLQDYDEAFKYYQAGFDANRNPFANHVLSYRVSYSQSIIIKTQERLENLDKVIQLYSDQGFALETILGKLSKLFVYYESDQYEGLTALAVEIVENASQRGLRSIRVIASMLLNLINLRQGSQDADQSYQMLIQDARSLSNPLLELTIIMNYCRVYRSMEKVFRVDQGRIIQLLDQLEVCAQEPLIRSSFLNFRVSLENCENPN